MHKIHLKIEVSLKLPLNYKAKKMRKTILSILMFLLSFDGLAKNCEPPTKNELKQMQETTFKNDPHFLRLSTATVFYSKLFSDALSAYNGKEAQISNNTPKETATKIANEIHDSIDNSFFKKQEKNDFLKLAIQVIIAKNKQKHLENLHLKLIKHEYLFKKSSKDLAEFIRKKTVPKFKKITTKLKNCIPQPNAQLSLLMFENPNSADNAIYETSLILKKDLHSLQKILKNTTYASINLFEELDRRFTP